MLYKKWLESDSKDTFVKTKSLEINVTEEVVLNTIQNECRWLREMEYAPIKDQIEMQYDDLINGTTTWQDHINQVKNKYPKPQ